MSQHILKKAGILAGFLIFSMPLQADDLERRQAELKSLQSQIAKEQNVLKDASKRREKLQALLKQDEQAIASVAKAVKETRASLKQVDRKLEGLKGRSEELNRLKASQQATLSKQLASAYLAGSHDYTKMLLSQQNPAKVERMLAYYQYLNNARMKAINELKLTMDELRQNHAEQIDEQEKLTALAAKQQEQSKRLEAEQSQRQATIKELQKTLSSRGAELEQLQIEEASLKRVLDQALKAVKDSPKLTGLASQRGKLSWPTKGSLSESFGAARSGQIKWKGVVLSAPEGQDIKAISDGKVIYADWLKGFGMVLVLDHGHGYMSLYGHAQALLKSPGDLVNGGETVALVGRSGGQTEPGLYFEIRHKGQAVDPATYCKR
ncbi:peptidoglycan DD-metalloendopeptidase family protein [Shewanella sp. JM162201]|uniref:Peptidoglycan DD-metalloendopeptidase family protein n=1 Tax=Shewanella jiangmenensis TaxID=2837387 RepID=A0ABS5V6Y6_9GAMM|nr:peptidoglycan DD-metalloendopeptidase family protein [Shewanella jiangmenensis]MBT1446196.1 peptidoglycan DD-metalloendopeptidase family protein [Shewanella jiangmenensis]